MLRLTNLLYGIESYANTYASYLDKLIKINNKIFRLLLNQSMFHSCMKCSSAVGSSSADRAFVSGLTYYVSRVML